LDRPGALKGAISKKPFSSSIFADLMGTFPGHAMDFLHKPVTLPLGEPIWLHRSPCGTFSRRLPDESRITVRYLFSPVLLCSRYFWRLHTSPATRSRSCLHLGIHCRPLTEWRRTMGLVKGPSHCRPKWVVDIFLLGWSSIGLVHNSPQGIHIYISVMARWLTTWSARMSSFL